jgi:hypothetical protein
MRLHTHGIALLFLLTVMLSACGGGGGEGGSGKAKLRMLNLSPDYTSLDLYLDDDLQLSAVAFEAITAYDEVTADSYELRVKRAGISSTLSSFDDTLGQGSSTTYVAYGATGGFGVIPLDDDRDEPDKDKTSVEIVDAAVDAGSLDVYLTDDSSSLDDASPDFSGVGAGTMTGQLEFDSGTYRLRVVAAGSKSDIRLDVSGVTLASKENLSIVLSNTPGGALVNGILVPQQGDISMLRNANARVRAGAGVGAGSTVTATLGGVTLVSATNGATLGAYRLVASGTLTPEITVDGASVSSSSVTVSPGADYTLLTYKDGGQVVTNLLTDNNRLPASGYAKIRLLNSMSVLAEPLTLTVDFYPIAEAVPLGQASDGLQVDPMSDGQIDVTRSNTALPVYTRTSVQLDSRAVYTMAMFGDATTPVGVLRKDR